MLKGYFNAIITINILLIIITLYPLLPILAHGQRFGTNQTIKNQIYRASRSTTGSYSFPTFRTGGLNNTNNNDNASNGNSSNNSSSSSSSSIGNQVAILNFYDDIKSQITNVKPILDKYGFKGTFFIVCNWAGALKSQTPRMTWQDITQLYREGHDIESHSMTHKRLNELSAASLDFELGQSKQCLHDHLGIDATVFSPPHSAGWDNSTVINAIEKYYDLSIGGFVNDVTFLHCYGWKQLQNKQQQQLNQVDCRTYSDDGTLNYANRYDIKENPSVQGHSNDTLIFDRFANLFNREKLLNNNSHNNGTTSINSVLILGYHSIDNYELSKDTIDIPLFDKEMKYLHDNGFRVLRMSDLGYYENGKYLYIRK